MTGFLDGLRRKVRNQERRDEFVAAQIAKLTSGSLLLDAGCGSQRYRHLCGHLEYRSQDFGQYTVDEKKMIGTEGAGGAQGYMYGPLDYTGDAWDIEEEDAKFDAILCTEVFEHIPYPIETVREFSRLLKKGGMLILTFPSVSLRHFDPFYFYSGFSDRWAEKILPENGFELLSVESDGDYYGFMSVELKRIFRNSGLLGKLATMPALAYTLLQPRTGLSVSTLSEGLFVTARKL